MQPPQPFRLGRIDENGPVHQVGQLRRGREDALQHDHVARLDRDRRARPNAAGPVEPAEPRGPARTQRHQGFGPDPAPVVVQRQCLPIVRRPGGPAGWPVEEIVGVDERRTGRLGNASRDGGLASGAVTVDRDHEDSGLRCPPAADRPDHQPG